MDSPGMKLIARNSYSQMADEIGSPFDYPLSSRFDENDAILILDSVLVPWENVFVYGDVEKFNVFGPESGFASRLTPRRPLSSCLTYCRLMSDRL
jgi:4-hydroxyphenylacetate 3-monooxygenase